MTKFVLPDLPYDFGALEPHLSAKILELHHDKHHKAYVVGANEALDALVDAREKKDVKRIPALQRALSFNAAGHVLHSIYWSNMAPKAGGMPTGDIADAINRDFGGLENLKSQMTQLAMTTMGSGWSVLGWDPLRKCLTTAQIHDHQLDLMPGMVPLMVIDTWEHAFYLQYQTDKAKYFDAIWNLWNWKDVNDRLAAAKKLDLMLKKAAE